MQRSRLFKIQILILTAISALSACSKPEKKEFEGIITYKVSVTSPTNNPYTVQLLKDLGDTLLIRFKDGKYRMDFKNGRVAYIIYQDSSNKQYTLINAVDTIYIDDCSTEARTLDRVSLENSSTNILNMQCQKFTMFLGTDTTEYYYSSDLMISPFRYNKHVYSFVNTYYENCKAPYLKYVKRGKIFHISYEAIEVKACNLDASVFSPDAFPISKYLKQALSK